MKRVLWTVALALVGFWGGWYAQGYPLNFAMLAIFTIWAGCIGFGFGSIFSEHRSGRRIVYWMVTFGLIGPPPALTIPIPSIVLRLGIGVSLGALLGALFGTLQAWLVRRKPGSTDAGAAAG
jgi:hypothetical protein